MSSSVEPLDSNIEHSIFLVNRRFDIDLGKNFAMNTLGTRIRSARKEAGLTQVELARKVRITQPTLSDLENGHTDSTSSLVELAMALGVRPEWLATGKGDREPQETRIGENTAKEMPDAYLRETIPNIIRQLQTLHEEIERVLEVLSGLPSLSGESEHSYGRDVSPSHDLRKSAKRLPNLWPEVTDHAEHRTKPRSNKT